MQLYDKQFTTSCRKSIISFFLISSSCQATCDATLFVVGKICVHTLQVPHEYGVSGATPCKDGRSEGLRGSATSQRSHVSRPLRCDTSNLSRPALSPFILSLSLSLSLSLTSRPSSSLKYHLVQHVEATAI